VCFKGTPLLIIDEAYARWLQEEENEIDHHDNRMPGPVNSTPQSSSKRIQQVVGLNIDKSLNMTPPQIPKVVSLTEIMNEEREKENEKRELVRNLYFNFKLHLIEKSCRKDAVIFLNMFLMFQSDTNLKIY